MQVTELQDLQYQLVISVVVGPSLGASHRASGPLRSVGNFVDYVGKQLSRRSDVDWSDSKCPDLGRTVNVQTYLLSRTVNVQTYLLGLENCSK